MNHLARNVTSNNQCFGVTEVSIANSFDQSVLCYCYCYCCCCCCCCCWK